MSQECPKFQAIMNKAYEGYKPSMRYKDFLRSLDAKTAGLVALGNLNYQVENGGFHQWYSNGYHEGLPYLLPFLHDLGTVEATRVAIWASRVTQEMTYAIEDDEDTAQLLDAHDEKYYAIQDKLLGQVEATL